MDFNYNIDLRFIDLVRHIRLTIFCADNGVYRCKQLYVDYIWKFEYGNSTIVDARLYHDFKSHQDIKSYISVAFDNREHFDIFLNNLRNNGVFIIPNEISNLLTFDGTYHDSQNVNMDYLSFQCSEHFVNQDYSDLSEYEIEIDSLNDTLDHYIDESNWNFFDQAFLTTDEIVVTHEDIALKICADKDQNEAESDSSEESNSKVNFNFKDFMEADSLTSFTHSEESSEECYGDSIDLSEFRMTDDEDFDPCNIMSPDHFELDLIDEVAESKKSIDSDFLADLDINDFTSLSPVKSNAIPFKIYEDEDDIEDISIINQKDDNSALQDVTNVTKKNSK